MSKLIAAGFFFILVLAGCQTADPAGPYTATWARFYLETNDDRASTVVLPRSGSRVQIESRPVLSENDIGNVELVQVDLGKCLMFQLTPGAARDLYRFSASSQGRRLVLMINTVPLGARRIDGPMAEGTVLIFVEMPDEQLPALVANLKRSAAALQHELAKR